MIEIQCSLTCDECETAKAPLTLLVTGVVDVAKSQALAIGGIRLPDGWEEYREPYSYGSGRDRTLCPACLATKRKERW